MLSRPFFWRLKSVQSNPDTGSGVCDIGECRALSITPFFLGQNATKDDFFSFWDMWWLLCADTAEGTLRYRQLMSFHYRPLRPGPICNEGYTFLSGYATTALHRSSTAILHAFNRQCSYAIIQPRVSRPQVVNVDVATECSSVGRAFEGREMPSPEDWMNILSAEGQSQALTNSKYDGAIASEGDNKYLDRVRGSNYTVPNALDYQWLSNKHTAPQGRMSCRQFPAKSQPFHEYIHTTFFSKTSILLFAIPSFRQTNLKHSTKAWLSRSYQLLSA